MKRNAVSLSTIAAIAALIVWGVFGQSAQAQKTGYVTRGKTLFTKYCASCHGTDGKGQGSVAMALKGSPPDLTMVQPPGEKFPFYEVQTKIDGEKAVTAHGTSKMPVWGTVLRRTSGELQKEAEIYALAKYIESIQVNKK